jgi:acylphosphatase
MKLKATIIGEVHDVGYRVFLTNIALEFGIDRFNVFNTFIEGKESVLCLIDAEEEILNRLKERINTKKPDGAIVEDIRYEDYKNTVPPIERCMQAFQMEHWGRAIPIMLNMIDTQKEMLGNQNQMIDKQDETLEEIRDTRREVVGKQDQMLEKQDQMLEKQDQMLEKQDQMLGKQDQMLEKQDQMLGKQDQMLGKQDQMLGKQDEMLGKQDEMLGKQDQMLGKQDETLGEIRGIRQDLKSYMNERFNYPDDFVVGSQKS